MKDELATIQPAKTEMSVPQLLAAAIQGGVTAESVGVVERLINLQIDMQKREALAAFDDAFYRLQCDCEPIQASKVIPDGKGGIRSVYAPIEEINKAVKPLLKRHGFYDTYSQKKLDNGQTEVTATIKRGGQSLSSSFTCGKQASPGNTEAQNDIGSAKMAKRQALCMLLGIQIDLVSDPRNEGDTINKDEAADLERRVLAISKGDDKQVERYLKLADAANFAAVKRAKYEVVIQLVEMKERAK